jgi:tetratricopeptide (TPR) repeat protein
MIAPVRLLAVVPFAALLVAAPLVFAQSPPASERPSLDESRPAPDAKPPAADKTEKPSDPVSRVHAGEVPSGPLARRALLQDLYALLATAESEEAAKKVASAIERLWAQTGSPTVGVLMQRGIKAMGQGKTDLAGQMFDAVVDLAPDYAEGWNRRAYFLYKQNDVTRALGDLRRAIALDPSHYRAIEGMASILREAGDERRAFQAYERLMEVNPMGDGVQKAYEELKIKVQGRGI